MHLPIYILLLHCPHLNEIDLKTIAGLLRQDGLLCTFPSIHPWMTLMTNKAESDEQFTQLMGGAIELRFTIGKGLVHLQMALSAMSLVDDIRDIEHVTDNPTRLLVLENTLRGLINRLGFLNLEMLDIAVSLDVLPTKTSNRGCVMVI